MVVWIQNPFDALPSEGSRKMRYWLLAEAFARAGHRVTLWTSDFSHATKRRRALVEATGATGAASGTRGLASPTSLTPLTSHDIEVRLVPTLPYSRNVSLARVRSHRAYAAAWRRLAQAPALPRPELLVSSVPTLSGAETALDLGRRFGARVVVDVQDAWPETFERLAPRGLRWAARLALTPLRRRARRVYRDADRVTGVCERYRALTGRPDYYLAYHGIEVEKLRSGDSSSRRSSVPLSRSSTSLVYAGNLGRTYDLATVVKAVEADPRLSLDVAGFGEFACDCPRVRFRGHLSEPDLRKLYASCDVGVVPMPPESWVGIPNKFLDYARAGLKIVSSLGGETSELLARWRCGATYRPGDVASFAAAVAAAASLPFGASRRMCEAVFDAERISDAYVAEVTAGADEDSCRRKETNG